MGTHQTYTPEVLRQIAREMIEWFAVPENYWLKDFAINKGIWWQKFEAFSDRCEEFGEALKICKDMQESKLVKLGLHKKNNVAMAIFALKNVAGWRDTVDYTHKGEVKFKHVDAMNEEEMIAEFDRILEQNGISTAALGKDSQTAIRGDGEDGSEVRDA